MQNDNSNTGVYKETSKLASEHYENFPVASFLFPSHLRKDISVIYTFARHADDIADEGELSESERVDKLGEFSFRFQQALSGNYISDFWRVLHHTILKRKLNPHNFSKLLSAFEQDIRKKNYSTFEELLNYCERSANPVGRIILQLYNKENEHTSLSSDKICTALQLTNFLQDVSVDIRKGRIYLPEADMAKFGVGKDDFYENETSKELRKLVEYEIDIVDDLFIQGSDILNYLPYRLKMQIGWTINGGRAILKKIRKNDYEVLSKRPVLSKIDYINALLRALLF